ncbi:tRNA-binding protein [Pseudochelatococcus sp. G4_1912]|uniref:tRNA-binding protein n=1 Tax=Pseudochelatococcus sp. G4_1912 TaxID=3114288 RepID=UPI0039C62FB6
MSNVEDSSFKSQVVYDDFAKLDIRVGRVVEVQPFPKARNPSYKIAVDLGELGIKWSSAQITSYAIEDLIGIQVVCVVNFPPRNIAGFQSQVLILGVENAKGDIILLSPRSEVPKGNAIY